jgi:hypothetical protein
MAATVFPCRNFNILRLALSLLGRSAPNVLSYLATKSAPPLGAAGAESTAKSLTSIL